MSIEILFNLQGTFDSASQKELESNASEIGRRAGGRLEASLSDQFRTNFSRSVRSFGASFIGLNVLGGVFKDAITNAREFSRSIQEVNSLLPQNAKLTENSIRTLREFSVAYGTSAQTQARAFYNIISAGISGTANQLEVLKVSNRAATAGLVDIDTAAKGIVSSLNAYSASGLTAKQVSDALFVAVREGQTTFGELTGAIGNVASIAATAGISIDELTGAIAFVTKTGVDTNRTVTSLRSVIAQIIKPSEDALKAAEELGIEFDTLNLRSKGLIGFFDEIRTKTGGTEKALARLFPNVESLSSVFAIVNGNTKDFTRILNETKNGAGATATAFRDLASSSDFEFKKFESAISVISNQLGNSLIPLLTRSLRGFSALFGTGGQETQITLLNKELGKNVSRYNELVDVLKEAKAVSESSGAFSVRGQAAANQVKTATAELEKLTQQRAEILKRRSALENQANADSVNANLNSEKQKTNDALMEGKKRVLDIGNIGLTKLQILDNQFLMENEKLLQANELDILSRQEYEERKLELARTYKEQRELLQQEEELKQIASFNNIGNAFIINAKRMQVTAGQFASTITNVFAASIGNAFTKVGQALATGQDGFKAFGEGLKAVLGDIASAAGDLFIKWGIANIASQNYAVGAAQLAAGGALKILGGFLGSQSSSPGGSSGGGGGADTSSNIFNNPTPVDLASDNVQATPQTNVSVNVTGFVNADKDELGRFIADTVTSNFERQGTRIIGANA